MVGRVTGPRGRPCQDAWRGQSDCVAASRRHLSEGEDGVTSPRAAPGAGVALQEKWERWRRGAAGRAAR